MSADHLFALPSDFIKQTSDECYTPRWVFDAMGLEFDLDVAAPPGGPWHVPAKRYFAADQDGLAQAWDGSVWCNPPYSKVTPWADRWVDHYRGVLMATYAPECRWVGRVFRAADAVVFPSVKFTTPDGNLIKPRHGVFVAFRGLGCGPAERLAAADSHGAAVLYGKDGRA